MARNLFILDSLWLLFITFIVFVGLAFYHFIQKTSMAQAFSHVISIQNFRDTPFADHLIQVLSRYFFRTKSPRFLQSLHPNIFFNLFFDLNIKEPIVVQEGQEVDMSIKVQGKYVPDTVNWFQNGAPIFESNARKLWSEGRRYYLTLLEASQRDAGHYRCESTTKLGTTVSDFVIKVEGMDLKFSFFSGVLLRFRYVSQDYISLEYRSRSRNNFWKHLLSCFHY